MTRPRSLVTGAAGFIGSHLCQRLVVEGHAVIGLDCFTDYYPRAAKEANLAPLRAHPDFAFVEANLLTADLTGLLRNVDFAFHLAAQAGVRGSWGAQFEAYVANNVLATQRILEAARAGGGRLRRLVYASSSSIYGDAPELPLGEEATPRPVSPYGVTKLAGEHLCTLYWRSQGVPTVALRYFTVYGPRQRPDMAFHRFVRSLLRGEPVTIFGDGEQTRDFTFVADAVEATLLALGEGLAGQVFNVGGGSRVSVNAALAILEELTGKRAVRDHRPSEQGDMRHTTAAVERAGAILRFAPRVGIREGLEAQLAWQARALGA